MVLVEGRWQPKGLSPGIVGSLDRCKPTGPIGKESGMTAEQHKSHQAKMALIPCDECGQPLGEYGWDGVRVKGGYGLFTDWLGHEYARDWSLPLTDRDLVMIDAHLTVHWCEKCMTRLFESFASLRRIHGFRSIPPDCIRKRDAAQS